MHQWCQTDPNELLRINIDSKLKNALRDNVRLNWMRNTKGTRAIVMGCQLSDIDIRLLAFTRVQRVALTATGHIYSGADLGTLLYFRRELLFLLHSKKSLLQILRSEASLPSWRGGVPQSARQAQNIQPNLWDNPPPEIV